MSLTFCSKYRGSILKVASSGEDGAAVSVLDSGKVVKLSRGSTVVAIAPEF